MSAPLLTSYIVLWVVVLTICVAVLALYHHFGEMYLSSREGREAQGPDVGEPARRVQVQDVLGTERVVPPSGRPTLIFFSDPTCRLCTKLKPSLLTFAESQEDIELAVICGGDRAAVRDWADGLASSVVVVADPGYRIATRYGIGVTPFVVAVNEQGEIVTKGVVNDEHGLAMAADAAVTMLEDVEEEEVVKT